MREGYKKTEVGVIPDDWEVKKVGDCAEVTKLAGFEFTEYIEYKDDGEIIALRALNLKNGKLVLNDIKKIDKKVSENLQRSKLFKGDMLFSYVGTVGEIALVEENDKYHLAPNVAKIKFNNILPQFGKEYFVGSKIKNEIKKYITTTSQPALSMENIRKMKMIIPPLKEQEKIAEILSTVDSQIDDTEKLIEKSKELKKGLMQKLLTKGIGHSEFKKTEVGEIPVEWEVKRLKDIANIRRGASPRPIKDPKWFSDKEEIGWIRISDVTSSSKYLFSTTQYLSEEGKNKSRFVKDGDLIMSICATVGKPIIIKMNACIHDGFVLLDEIDIQMYDKGFLYYVLQRYEESFKSMGQTGTQSNLNTELVGGLQIAVPSMKEQLRISNLLSSVDNEIEQYENKKQKLEELKKGLMQQLLTGKIRCI